MQPTWRAQLGHGGQGVVFLGALPGRTESVVLKRPHIDRPLARERFEHEIAVLSGLEHPCVVPYLGRGEDDTGPWFAMAYAAGGTLAQRAAPMDQDEARPWLVGLLRALSHAHARGALHLDVSPRNLLWADSGPWLADFGAGVPQGVHRAPPLGTPATMAPECFERAGDLGPWSDVYAVGCVAWWLCYGQPLRPGPTWADYADQHARGSIPEGGHALHGWLTRLLARRPADRPTAQQALAELGEGVGAPEPRYLEGHRPVVAELARGLAAARGGQPTTVVLRAPADADAPTLVRQFAAHHAEQTGATVLQASHHPLHPPTDQGLAGMLRAWLRGGDDARGDRVRLRAALGRLGAPSVSLASRLGQVLAASGPSARRFDAVLEWMRLLDGPLVVCVDGAPWGTETLHFVHHALKQPSLAALFALVVDHHASGARPIEDALLRGLPHQVVLPAPMRSPPAPSIDRLEGVADHAAVQVASMLGLVVEDSVWHAVAQAAHVDVPAGVLHRLIAAGLARQHPTRPGWWAFVDEGVRQRISATAPEPLAMSAHRAAASLLPADQAIPHLLALSAWDEAFERMLDRLWEALELGQSTAVDGYLALGEQIRPTRAGLQARYCLLRALHAQGEGDREGRERWRTTAEAHGAAELAPALHALVDAHQALTDGDIHRAADRYLDVLAHADPADPVHLRALIASGMADIRRGHLPQATRTLLGARHRCFWLDDAGGMMRCSFGLANAAVQRGDLDDAEQYVDDARQAAAASDSVRGLAECDTYYGEISRQRGDYGLAEAHYRDAMAGLQVIDPEEAWVARVNLASALLQQGQIEAARPHFEAVFGWAEPNASLIATAAAAGTVACVADGPDEAWARWWPEVEQRVASSPYVERDLAELLEIAATRAQAVGRADRQHAATDLAAAIWARLAVG